MIVVRVWSRIYGEEVGDQVLKFLPSALFVTGEMALATFSPEDPFPPSSKSLSSSSSSSSQSSQSSNPLLQVFLEGYLSKKAMEMVVERTPVFLVRADELGLRGADLLGCQILTIFNIIFVRRSRRRRKCATQYRSSTRKQGR